MTELGQVSLPGLQEHFLADLIDESISVIQDCAARSTKPLIIEFSGGRDSITLLGLVRESGVKDFVCCYMATGLELHGTVQFVKETCARFGVKLLISNPAMHKGNIFKRIERFQSFPNLGRFEGGGNRTWCCRDLKLRPQKKMINQLYGKGTYYRLEGIRRFESDRRKVIYRDYTETMMRPDEEFKGSWEVYPILNWSDEDVLAYLEAQRLPTMGLYKEFGVSGCSWCPFYDPALFARVLSVHPNHYDRFIEWEEKLNQPSVHGGVFLRDIKAAVLSGGPLPEAKKPEAKSLCMMEFEGRLVPTCSIYGHLWIDNTCYRCEVEEGE